jgi:large subunit ribosomal protein L20
VAATEPVEKGYDIAQGKTGVAAHRKHKKVLKITKGQRGTKHALFRRANEAMLASLRYATRDRRNRKRDMRRLWDHSHQRPARARTA